MKKLIDIKNKYEHLVKNEVFNFNKFNQYAIVHHSNAVEGSTLTLEETILLLDEHLTPKNKPLEHTFMALDHLEALKYVIELARNKTKISVNNIQEISAKVLKNTGSEISSMAGNFNSAKGDFRKVTVRAGETTFIDYKKVPKRVEKLVNEINIEIANVTSFKEIYNLAFDVHFQLVSIHPFADGNGRVSRLLMNFIQAYHKQPLTVVFKEDKQDYFNALVATRKQEDITIFRRFMFQQAEKYFNQQITELTKPQKEIKNTKGLSFLF